MKNIRTRILGTGSYLPEDVWTNNDLSRLMETSDEWIVQRTGIKQRHWAKDSQTTSDLAYEASVKAITNAGIDKKEIDLIILGTLSPDHEFPGVSCFLQAKLGLSEIAVLDIRQQCSGFIYGLSIADQFIKTGMYKKILLVGAELHSRGLDRTTRGRDVAVLFGDGAGAIVLGATENPTDPGVFSTHLHADGSFAKELWTPAPGMGNPKERVNHAMIENGDIYPKMNGKTVFMHAVKRMPEAIMEALKANSFSIQDVDLFVFHQANLRINEMVAKQLKIPDEKVFNTIDRFANTTAATIPIGLDYAVREGKLKSGMLVAMAAFGSGFTWGSALVRW